MRRIPFLLLFAGLSGCSFLFGPSLPSLRGYHPVSRPEAETFIGALNSRAAAVHRGQGEYQAILTKSIRQQALKQIVAFSRPKQLRVELFVSKLNQLALMLVAHDGELQGLDPKENAVYRGESTPQNLARLTGVPLVPDELMLWFAGCFEIRPGAVVEILKGKDGTFAISGDLDFERSVIARFEVPANNAPRLISLELRPKGKKDIFFFSEFEYDSETMPKKISFHLSEQDLRGTLKRGQFRLNPPALDPRLFQIPLREGMTVKNLDSYDRGRE